MLFPAKSMDMLCLLERLLNVIDNLTLFYLQIFKIVTILKIRVLSNNLHLFSS